MQDLNLNHRQLRRSVIAVWRLKDLVIAFLLSLAAFTTSSADEVQLSVPVRVLGAPQPTPEMAPAIVPREAEPLATPAARMPQYQLHHKDLGRSGDLSSPQIRFVLATPGQPLLIEASVFIDGEPFQQARERQVQEIMRYIADPVTFKAEADRIAAQAQASAPATDSPGLIESIQNLVFGDASSETLQAPEPEKSDVPEVATPADAEGPEAKESEPETPEVEIPAAQSAAEVAPAEPAVPAVPKYAASASIYERIDRYTSSTGVPPTADEVRWLLTTWVNGPVLLFLNDNFQRFRANQQPVFRILDRDRNHIISADELTKAVASFQECDLNRDGIVEATELAQAASDARDNSAVPSGGKLVYQLPDEVSANTFLRRLAANYAAPDAEVPVLPRFDLDSNGALSPSELKQLQDRPADVRLKLELTTAEAGSSRLTVQGFSDEFAGLKNTATKNPYSLTLRFPSFNLEFSSAQESGGDQISIGAVNDGYAMLQEIDPNADGRFSIRELRQLNERLTAFDRNSDGQITSDETHPTYRICIGLGPTAHQPLALLREAHVAETTAAVAGPEWFTEMDKNKDLDLTRQEFPGTDEQFKELDRDGDELISSVEAGQS